MFGNTPQSEAPVLPTFEELKGALPIELQAEFDTLGDWMSSLPLKYPGSEGENSYDGDALSPEEEVRHARFTELSNMATEALKQSGWIPEKPKAQGLRQRLHDTLANFIN
ncbi:MAG: hypothetical protein PHY14_01875 [Candidatus Gracilibacteria bacterium]|nr:hypothetical protein [Candidatus Gracilibacteria bacterium]